MNIKTNKFKVESPRRRSGVAVAAMEMGYRVIPNKKKQAEKQSCRKWKDEKNA